MLVRSFGRQEATCTVRLGSSRPLPLLLDDDDLVVTDDAADEEYPKSKFACAKSDPYGANFTHGPRPGRAHRPYF